MISIRQIRNALIKKLGGYTNIDLNYEKALQAAATYRQTSDIYQRKLARIKGRVAAYDVRDDFGRKVRVEDLLA
ncbi:hypothetical protein RSB1_gp23 [Ralstonia phage RSB1]|uniref:Uncharacterized protein n=1 Tax=Ralstonia phage RSB1 TaxID=551790 RepID=B5BTV9_9CAUD|nr:hypothetical protein RSB1_gp23 [Ralstonia phage RSB1]BAG70381.1 hypothetical protein [Ralstonia phage RSB1]